MHLLVFWGQAHTLVTVPPRPQIHGDTFTFGEGTHPWHAPNKGHNVNKLHIEDATDLVTACRERVRLLPDEGSLTHWFEVVDGDLVVTYNAEAQRSDEWRARLASICQRLGVGSELKMAYRVKEVHEIAPEGLPSWAKRAVRVFCVTTGENPGNAFYDSDVLFVLLR